MRAGIEVRVKFQFFGHARARLWAGLSVEGWGRRLSVSCVDFFFCSLDHRLRQQSPVSRAAQPSIGPMSTARKKPNSDLNSPPSNQHGASRSAM